MATINKIIDDFMNCNEIEDCKDCAAFLENPNLDSEEFAGFNRNDYCRLLRTYKGMLTEALYKEIDKL